MSSSTEEPSRVVVWGRRLGKTFRWATVVALLGGVAGSIIYQVMFAAPLEGSLRADSCEAELARLDGDLRAYSAAAVGAEASPPRPQRIAFFERWDNALSVVRHVCRSDAAMIQAASRLQRLRYAHESLLDRFERDLVPLRDEIARSLEGPAHD